MLLLNLLKVDLLRGTFQLRFEDLEVGLIFDDNMLIEQTTDTLRLMNLRLGVC